MNLALISGAYPPDLDGIGDYTWWLANALAKQHDVHIFTRISAEHRPSPGAKVVPFFDLKTPSSFASLLPQIELWSKQSNEKCWLVLQYNPFGYGRRGYCPWVPRTLRLIKLRCPKVKLAVMFHETQVPYWPLRFAIPFTWQHPIFRAVCRQADIAFVSTTRWTPQVQRVVPSLEIHHLPVGSNIPLRDVSRDEARMKLGIGRDALVLGVFGGAHISRRLDWIAATVAEAKRRHRGRKTSLLYIGPSSDAMRHTFGVTDLIDCGALPGEEVGTRMRAMDAAISPFHDGVSTRRGSVMALLQHGVPIATTKAAWSDQVFQKSTPVGLLVSSASSAETFTLESVGWLDRLPSGQVPDIELTRFHDRNFSWQDIADTMMRYLR